MVRNIIPEGVECVFVRQAEQLGLGPAVLCAERVVGGDSFAVLLADDFLTDYAPGVTADLAEAFVDSGKSQLSVMEVDGSDISKYGVVVPNGAGSGIAGLIEKPNAGEAPSNLASIGRYVLTPDIFETLRGLGAGSGGEIQLADAINIHAQRGSVEAVRLKGLRFDCGSVDRFMRASQHEYQRRQSH
jgi:UTP--glucose-1-phosphate uridylyltransferase